MGGWRAIAIHGVRSMYGYGLPYPLGSVADEMKKGYGKPYPYMRTDLMAPCINPARRHHRLRGPGGYKVCPRLDPLENTMQRRRRHREQTPPLETMSFMQEVACNRLAEAEMVFLPEFEHPPNGFLTRSGSGESCFRRRCLKGCFPSEEEKVFLHGHAAGLCPREKACFHFRL